MLKVRKNVLRMIAGLLSFTILLSVFILPAMTVNAYSPLTMYTAEPAASVRYGTLYPHAIQLQYQNNGAFLG